MQFTTRDFATFMCQTCLKIGTMLKPIVKQHTVAICLAFTVKTNSNFCLALLAEIAMDVPSMDFGWEVIIMETQMDGRGQMAPGSIQLLE